MTTMLQNKNASSTLLKRLRDPDWIGCADPYRWLSPKPLQRLWRCRHFYFFA
jgi:hypothetical protein